MRPWVSVLAGLQISGVPCARARHQEVVDLFTRVIQTAQPQSLFAAGGKKGSSEDLTGFANSGGDLGGALLPGVLPCNRRLFDLSLLVVFWLW